MSDVTNDHPVHIAEALTDSWYQDHPEIEKVWRLDLDKRIAAAIQAERDVLTEELRQRRKLEMAMARQNLLPVETPEGSPDDIACGIVESWWSLRAPSLDLYTLVPPVAAAIQSARERADRAEQRAADAERTIAGLRRVLEGISETEPESTDISPGQHRDCNQCLEMIDLAAQALYSKST